MISHLTDEEEIEYLELLELEYDRISFADFCVNAGYHRPYPKQVEMMNFGIYDHGIRMMLGSRGYGKTDYVTCMGAAYDIYRNPSRRYLIASKSDDRNAAMLTEIATALKLHGVALSKDSATAVRVRGLVGKDHSVSAITMGSGSIRGRHPDKIILDDPVTPEDVSESTRNKALIVYNELNKLCSDVLLIGQPVHKFDLYQHLRDLPGVKKLLLPYGTIPILDPDLEAQRLAGVSEESIQASYHLKVISQSGNPLAAVKEADVWPAGGTAVAFVDPSFEGGDFTAMTILKMHMGGVVVRGYCWKRAWYDCCDDFLEKCEASGTAKLYFETNSLGEQPIRVLREVFEKSKIGVAGKFTTGNKHARISAAGPFAGNIHITRDSDDVYKKQVRQYEAKSKNDDAPDSLASALIRVGLIHIRGRI
jgi:hypothetical protein